MRKKRIFTLALIFSIILSAAFGWSEKNIGSYGSEVTVGAFFSGANTTEGIYNEVHTAPIRVLLSAKRTSSGEREGLHGNASSPVVCGSIPFLVGFVYYIAFCGAVLFVFLCIISFIHAKDGKKRVHPFS